MEAHIEAVRKQLDEIGANSVSKEKFDDLHAALLAERAKTRLLMERRERVHRISGDDFEEMVNEEVSDKNNNGGDGDGEKAKPTIVDRPAQCPVCSRSYAAASSLKRHIKSRHSALKQ